MNKTLLVAALLVANLANANPVKIEAGDYAVDAAHTKVGFDIAHLVISTVEGRFDQFGGNVVMGSKIEDTKINANIDVASINTGNVDRDKHLKSPDFFDAEKFPKITFVSKKITGKAEALKISGDLTIHGVTKPEIGRAHV